MDPLARTTFSGLSFRLFDQLAARGWHVAPLASRQLHWRDVLTGAVQPRALLGRTAANRRAPLVSPNWIWSRRGFDTLNNRLARQLAEFPVSVPVLQIGSQTDPSSAGSGRRFVTMTDCTVQQALDAGMFSVSQANSRVQAEAVACQRQVFYNSHRVLVLSDWARRSVIDDYGIDPERVLTVGAGANMTEPLPRAVDQERPVVLFVGRDWGQKGGPLLLEAFRIVRERAPAARLVIVGCTPPVQGEPGVEVIGTLDRTNPDADLHLRSLYASATCFALLSAFDAFPNVLLEAAMCGVPVVSTNQGSRPEVVVHGVTGLLIQSRQPRELATSILALMNDPALASAMGLAAQRSVSERFTWPVVAAHVERALR